MPGAEGEVLPHEKILKLWTTLEEIGDNVWEYDFRTGKTYFSQKEFELLGYTTFRRDRQGRPVVEPPA